MKKFFFSVEAIMAVLNECYGMKGSQETGGIFIGPTDDNNIITHAIPSSIYAERGSITYYQSQEDIKILNKKIKQFFISGQDFKGYWHKHPSGIITLTDGDIETCLEMFHEPNYKIKNGALMTVISEGRGNMPLHSYHVRLQNGDVVVENVQMVILPQACMRTVWLNQNSIITKG